MNLHYEAELRAVKTLWTSSCSPPQNGSVGKAGDNNKHTLLVAARLHRASSRRNASRGTGSPATRAVMRRRGSARAGRRRCAAVSADHRPVLASGP